MERVKRRWWTATVTAMALVVVLGAVLSGLFQLAVMALPGYREQLSEYVSRVADRPIDIGGIALGWRGLAPRLELNDIVLYADDGETPALSADRLRIGFGLLRLLSGDTFPDQIELSGLEMVVEIDADNRVRLRGLDTRNTSSAQHDWSRELSRFDGIVLEDCDVLVDDARLTGTPPRFKLVSAQARKRFGGASVDASIELPDAVGESAELEVRVSGDLANPETLDGRWRFTLDTLKRLPWLEARLPGHPRLRFDVADLALSGAIEGGRIDSADIELTAAAIVGQRGEHLARLRTVQLRGHADYQAPSWTVEVPDLRMTGESGPWPATRLRLRWTPGAAGRGNEIEADADFLRLQDLAPWLMLSPDPSVARLQGVSGELSGLVTRGHFGGGAAPTYSARARLDKLGLRPQARIPGFSGLSGELSATEAGGRLALQSPGFVLDYGRVFAQPLALDQLGGELSWTRGEAGWAIALPAFSWEGLGTRGEGDFSLLIPNQPQESPQIKLLARFSGDDVLRVKPYMPQFWHENLRNWLTRAIVAGRVPRGELRIQGRLADFPFREQDGAKGVFTVDIDVADGKLAYAPDWPMADQVTAHLQFKADGLDMTGHGGRISGARIEQVSARIPDFKNAVLSIDGEVDGDAARYYEFLRQSPLAARLSGLLNRTEVSGPASVKVAIQIPLHDAKATQVSGDALMRGAQLTYRGLDEPVREIDGLLHFTNDGASGERITGTLYGTPASVTLASLGKGVTRLEADFDYAVQADGAGLSRYVPVFLRPRLKGSAHWRALALLGEPNSKGGFTLSSDLRGTAVDLPAPLGKAADTPVKLDLQIAGDDAGLAVGASYGERLGAHVVFDGRGGGLRADRALLLLGSGDVPTASESGLRVIGQADELDVAAWLSAFNAGNAGSGSNLNTAEEGLRLQGAQIQARRLRVQGHAIDNVSLTYKPENNGWTSSLQGPTTDGDLRWTAQPAPHLVGRFRQLRLGPRERAAPAQVDPTVPPGAPLDPNTLPTLDFDVQRLFLDQSEFGHATLRTSRIDAGQRIDLLEARDAEVSLKVGGEWRRRENASSARLDFQAEVRSVGEILKGLGYAESVDANLSRFKGQLSWAPAPAGLDWPVARGRIELQIEDGTLRALEPGAGRVLGLINFYALPRRLLLDFSDVVSKGLGFDSINGHFDLADGNAVTQDINIDAPSLKLEMRGRVGLVARDYDQHVRVYPDVSSGVTLGALLLGGPAAGALALVAQQVLDKPLDQATQLSYNVTGSWDNPQIRRGDEPEPLTPPAVKKPPQPGAVKPKAAARN